MIVLDTHAVVWWTILPSALGRGATTAIAKADRLLIPTIVFWEVAQLTRKGRLALDMPVADWASEVLAIPRVEPVPLTAMAAVRADTLPMHPDPVDRFIVATALELQAPIVTRDRVIRRGKLVATLW